MVNNEIFSYAKPYKCFVFVYIYALFTSIFIILSTENQFIDKLKLKTSTQLNENEEEISKKEMKSSCDRCTPKSVTWADENGETLEQSITIE